MEWYFYPALIAAGILAGFINTLAGSGSLITLPLLMFMGLPANIANATNRIGVLLQSAVGAASFKNQKVFDYSEGIWLAIPATLGSFLGAIAAVKLSSRVMEIVIGVLLLFMFFIVLYKPEKWIQENAGRIEGKPKFWQILIFFLIGLYGGFIQIGVGFMLLGGLVLGAGVNLTKANALKAFIVFIYTSVALGVFVFNGQIDYLAGFVLAIGNMLGAYIASKIAVKRGPRVVRVILLIVVFLAALKYTGAIDLVIGLFSR